MDVDIYNQTYDRFCNSIKKKNAEILEIGCGPGNITKYLLSKRPDFNLLGIDVAPNMIELAEKNNPSANFKVMDCRNIKDLDTKYDGIICGFCIPFLTQEDRSRFIADCHSILNDESTIYISFMDGSPEQSGYKTGSNGAQVYFNYHRLEDLTNDLTRNGFAKPEVFRIDYTPTEVHTIVISKK